jgi:hypothetical protein
VVAQNPASEEVGGRGTDGNKTCQKTLRLNIKFLRLKEHLSLLIIHGFAPLPEGALDSFDEKDRENFEELLNIMRTKTLYFFMQEWVITDALLAILADIKNELKVVFSEDAEIVPDQSGQRGGSRTSLERLVFFLTAFFMLVAMSEGTNPTDSAKTSSSRSVDTDPNVVVPLHFSESMLTSSRLETAVPAENKQSLPEMIDYIKKYQSTNTEVYTHLFPDTSQLSTYQKLTSNKKYVSPEAVEVLVNYLNRQLTKSYNDQQALCNEKIFLLSSLGLLQTFEYNPAKISEFLQKLKKENTPEIWNGYLRYFDWFKNDKINVHNNQTGVQVVSRGSEAKRLFEQVCNNFPRVKIISNQNNKGNFLTIVRPQNMDAIRYVFEVLSLNVMFSEKFEEHSDLNLMMVDTLGKSARADIRKMTFGYITYMQRYFNELDKLASNIENIVDEMKDLAKTVHRNGLENRELTFDGIETAFMTVLRSLENVMKLNLDLTQYKDATMTFINKERADYLAELTFITNDITDAIKTLHKAQIKYQLSGITPYFSMMYELVSGFRDIVFNNLWEASSIMAFLLLVYAIGGSLPIAGRAIIGNVFVPFTENVGAFLNMITAYYEMKTGKLKGINTSQIVYGTPTEQNTKQPTGQPNGQDNGQENGQKPTGQPNGQDITKQQTPVNTAFLNSPAF